MSDDKPKAMQLFGARTLLSGAPFIEVIRQDGSGKGYGVIKVDCDSKEEFESLAAYLANEHIVTAALQSVVPLLAGLSIDVNIPTNIRRLADGTLLAIEQGYFSATGKRLDGKPAEELDEWRRGLGLDAKFGHLSEIEVKRLCRDLDEVSGREYNPDEPIESQAKRVAVQIRLDCEGWEDVSAKARTLKVALELESGHWADRGKGSLAEVDEVLGRIPRRAFGSMNLDPNK